MQIPQLLIVLAGLLTASIQAAPASSGTEAIVARNIESPIDHHCGPSTYVNHISSSLVDDCQKMLDNLSPDAGGGGEDGFGRGDKDWTIVGDYHRVIGNFSTCAFGCHVTNPTDGIAMLGIEDVHRVVMDSIAKFKHAEDGEQEKVGAQGDFICEFAGNADKTIGWFIYNPYDRDSTGPGSGPWSTS
ncbi:hypothetical protein QBC40DRAFT_330225 [Triangularia verruculosa]|uniref:Ecp2 effector protein-like domain-containing protein n=1 Tax=Triangularia verruculosa TaxID=2587418 RepID=A0AAN6XDT4_9PEZI|nr:hypothetical protein QBC40DRAFT_330225 [Triangularia verruculosa]